MHSPARGGWRPGGNRYTGVLMLRVAILGLGVMGCTHLAAYRRTPNCRVVAALTRDVSALRARLSTTIVAPFHGNPPGHQSPGGPQVDLHGIKLYTALPDLLGDPEVDAVDICLPTDQHHASALGCVSSKKHVLLESPAGRTAASARLLARAAREAGVLAMPAMAQRFWPGWSTLKDLAGSGRFGRFLSLHCRRLASFPGTDFHRDDQRSGGAILDLHLHDTDFICHVLGSPNGVISIGRSTLTRGIDHIVSLYDFGEGGPVVSSEGSWAMSEGTPFVMSYIANFDKATVIYDHQSEPRLVMHHGGKTDTVNIAPGTGYDHEIAHFVDCALTGKTPIVTLDDAAESISVVEAERESAQAGGAPVAVRVARLKLLI
jgi:predicted dehydrogenase